MAFAMPPLPTGEAKRKNTPTPEKSGRRSAVPPAFYAKHLHSTHLCCNGHTRRVLPGFFQNRSSQNLRNDFPFCIAELSTCRSSLCRPSKGTTFHQRPFDCNMFLTFCQAFSCNLEELPHQIPLILTQKPKYDIMKL